MPRKKKAAFPSDEEFVSLYKTNTNDELMHMFGATRAQLRYHVEQLGLNRTIKREKGVRAKTSQPDTETLRLLAKEYSGREIGAMYGVTNYAVYVWFKNVGINQKVKFTPDDAVFSQYTTADIAKMYGVCPSTVCRYRQKNNLPFVKNQKLPDDKILIALAESYTSLEIAKQFDVSSAAVEKRLRNIKRMNIHGQ